MNTTSEENVFEWPVPSLDSVFRSIRDSYELLSALVLDTIKHPPANAETLARHVESAESRLHALHYHIQMLELFAKMQRFDTEALNRENGYLRKMLDEVQNDRNQPPSAE